MRTLVLGLALLPTLALAQDADGDTIADGVDNCVSVPNTDQADDNLDGYGDACVSPTASLGTGVTLANGAVVGAGATVGAFADIASTTVIESDASVGQYVVLGGNTMVAIRSTLGGASVAPPSVDAPVFGFGSVLSRRSAIGDDFSIGDQNTYGRSVTIGDRLTAANGVSVGYGSTLGDDATLGAGTTVGTLVTLGNNATLGAGVVLGRGVTAGNTFTVNTGAFIGPDSIIGDNVQVHASARLRKNVTLGSGSTVEMGARVGRDVTVQAGATVGQNANIGTGSTILAGAIVPNGLVIPRNTIYGNASEVCTDGADNDADGLIDCEDSADCGADPSCFEDCTDSIDNNNDGDVDCADVACIADASCMQVSFNQTVNGMFFRQKVLEETHTPIQDTWSTAGGAGTCANLGSAYTMGAGVFTSRRENGMDVYSVQGAVTVNVPSGGGGVSPVTCNFTVGNAWFSGDGDTLTRQGIGSGSVDPGCGFTNLDFLPDQLTIVHTGSSNLGKLGSSPGNLALMWNDQNWYIPANQPETLGWNSYLATGSPGPTGPCGNTEASFLQAGTHQYNWGPDCQCAAEIARTGNSAAWSFYGGPTTVGVPAP